jgi:hypothetical protein
MAILKGPLQFTGSVGGFRSYKDGDTGKQVLSTKRTGDKKAFKKSKKSKNVKLVNTEFIALSIWTKLIRIETIDLAYLKKGRLNGKLVSIAKRIQLMDPSGDMGRKRIISSKFNFPLVGFNWNNAHPFDIVCNVDPEISITNDRRKVTIAMNNFKPFKKFHWTESVRYYRVYLNIFELPDIEWDKEHRKYAPVYPSNELGNETTVSEWLSANPEIIDFQIAAAFGEKYLPKEKALVVVSMGFEFASAIEHGTPFVVKDHGTAAIVGCF